MDLYHLFDLSIHKSLPLLGKFVSVCLDRKQDTFPFLIQSYNISYPPLYSLVVTVYKLGLTSKTFLLSTLYLKEVTQRFRTHQHEYQMQYARHCLVCRSSSSCSLPHWSRVGGANSPDKIPVHFLTWFLSHPKDQRMSITHFQQILLLVKLMLILHFNLVEPQCPQHWSNIILDVPSRVFLDNSRINGFE